MTCDSWVKMRTDLYRDTKVCGMADFLNFKSNVLRNVMRNAVVGALVPVWGMLRHRGKREGDDAVLKAHSISALDDIADMVDFGKAMEHVGWVIQREKTLVFPNFFEELNTDLEAERTRNAERQRRYRERKQDCGKSNVTVTLRNAPEQSREEKSIIEASASCSEPSSEPPPALIFPIIPKSKGALAEWSLTQAKLAEYQESFPDLDVMAHLRAARQWCLDNREKRKTATGMGRFLTTWLTKEQNRGAGGRNGKPLREQKARPLTDEEIYRLNTTGAL